MTNSAARSCIPRFSALLRHVSRNPDAGPIEYLQLRAKHSPSSPSEREIQEMNGRRYGLTKLRGCKQIIEVFNSEASSQGLKPFSDAEILSFDSIIPNFGIAFAERTFRAGTSSLPLQDVAAGSGYSVEVVEGALRGRLLPMEVCLLIKTSAESLFGTALPLPYTLRETDHRHSPVAVDEGRAAIISIFSARPLAVI